MGWLAFPRFMRILYTPLRLLWNRPLSLRVKLVVAALLVAVPSFLMSVLGDALIFQERRTELIQANLSTATTSANIVDASLQTALSVAWTVAVSPSTQSMDPATIDPILAELQKTGVPYSNVVVFDRQGRSVGEMMPYPSGATRQSGADQMVFQEVMRTNQASVSNVVTNPRSGNDAVVVGVPVRDSSGQPKGVVTVLLDVPDLQSQITAMPALRTRGVIVADPTGRVALSSGVELPAGSVSLAENPLFQTAKSSGAAVQRAGSFPPLSGTWIGAARSSPRFHWVVSVLQPASAVQASLGLAVWLEAVALIVALVLAAVAARYVSGRIVGPVQQLQRAARAWSQGDLDRRVAIISGDELESLGRAFNQMAGSLSETLQQLTDADLRLVSERNRLQAILNTSPVGIIVLDTNERLVLTNPAADLLIGEDLGALEPARNSPIVKQLYHPDGSPYRFDDLPAVRALRTGETIVGSEVVIRRPNGFEVHLMVNAAPVREASGAIVGGVAIFFDVSPIVEEERLRTEFVVSAAQEFRNPLTVIKGYAEVAMRDPVVKGTTIYQELQRITNAANRLARLADDLLHSAELHLPAIVLRRVPIDLSEITTEVVDTFEQREGAEQFKISLKAQPAMVDGDPKLLAEALTDLLRHAEAAMPDGGPIEVAVSTWDGVANVSVTDHGPVVPPEKISSLFQPFSVFGHETTYISTLRPSLPLYLAKRIVEESGGWIRAQSVSRGTTVSITLPRYVAESGADHSFELKTPTSNGVTATMGSASDEPLGSGGAP